jgi:hypothetical protein
MMRKPHSDFAKVVGPEHDFPAAWYGNCACRRCGIDLVTVEETQRPCVTDEAIALGRVVGRMRKIEANR